MDTHHFSFQKYHNSNSDVKNYMREEVTIGALGFSSLPEIIGSGQFGLVWFCAFKSALISGDCLDKFLQFSWEKFLEVVCHCHQR